MSGRGAGRGRPAGSGAGSAELTALLVEAVRRHRAGELKEAETRYRRVLKAAPRQADALHLLGVIAHQRGEHDQARRLIGKAIAINGGDAAYHNNLGTVLLALGRPERAAESLRRALSLNPAYAEAHNNLGNALQKLGHTEEAVASYRRALKLQPDYAEAHANLGRALHANGDLDGAIASYRAALARRPGYVRALKNLGDALAEQGRTEEAETCYRQALHEAPGDADTRAARAALLERASRLEEALAEAETALAAAPNHVRAATVAARCERRLGRPQEALGRLQALSSAHLERDAQASIAYEKGALLDRLGEYRRAYRCFAEGNRLIVGGPQGRSIDAGAFPAEIERLRCRFTREWVASWTPPLPSGERRPIFLFGFPRSGTTLLDQILDSHPALIGLEEKPAVDVVKQAVDALPGGYPEALAGLDAEQLAELRRIYFKEVDRYLQGDGIVVDKMPLNTIDVGLIHRLFPDAKLLLAVRHPLDVVLSGFMQAFRPNAAMVHFATLVGTARFYALVMGLWRQYEAVLPLDVLATRYEDLVADFTAETRRILAFLGLPWDDAVLAYRERAKERAIATPSYHQVVQPIYARSVGRWRNYRAELQSVIPLLEPFIEAFGYDPVDPSG